MSDGPGGFGLRDMMPIDNTNRLFCTCGQRLYPDCDVSAASIVEEFEGHLMRDHGVTRDAIEAWVGQEGADESGR